MTEKKILFICHMSTFFTEQVGIMKLCLERGIKPIMQFAIPLEYVRQNVQTCLDLGIEIYNSNGDKVINADDIPKLNISQTNIVREDDKKSLKHFIKEIKESPIYNWKSLHDRFKYRKVVMRNLLSELQPNLIVLGADIVGHDTSICVKMAHKFGIKVAVVTITMADGDDPADYLINNPLHEMNNFMNKITGMLFPKWVYKYRGHKLLRLPASQVFYYILKRIAPPKPWVLNSGFGDSIILDGNKHLDFYTRAGLDKKKLHVIGNLNNDKLYNIVSRKDENKLKLYEKYGFDKNKKLIVTALNPDYMMTGIKEFDENFDAVSEYWINTLKNTGWNVIGCPHPGFNEKYFEKFECNNFKINRGYTIDVIGLADLFVANISSTIKWAVICGIPVINYDMADLNFKEYQNNDGIIRVTTKKSFEEVLQKFIQNEKFYFDIQQKQQIQSSYWGLLDGKAGDRMMSHLQFLMEKK